MSEQPENKIEIRKIDSLVMLEACAKLYVEVFNCAPWDGEWTDETALSLLNCYYNTPEFTGLAAFLRGRLVGCAMGNTEPHYSGSIFYLRDMFVATSLQNMGTGSRLLIAIKAEAQLAGTKTMILFTQRTIFDYYKRFGFDEMEDMGMMSCTLPTART